ncbi:hypothetical protein E4H04_05045 [Candidatus Bathyarchaeota archaeon]|nr:MAG: hypothetical protein E4H04_05045 [Candidatus Bathyarchaeota archaeon]
MYPDEDLIIKTAIAYSYPAIKVSSLGYLKRIIHKYFILHIINDLAQKHLIDVRSLTGEKPLRGLVEELHAVLDDKKQVLAFTLDLGKISEQLSVDYLEEIIRVAKIEDARADHTEEV